MPSFPDTAVLVILAFLLFGPKKLPVLARQLGKLMADFRRASNEFRSQMEEELRISEQAERQKQIAAIEASAAPAVPPTPTPTVTPELPAASEHGDPYSHTYAALESPEDVRVMAEPSAPEPSPEPTVAPAPTPAPVPIATSGELSILPPATGLPIPNSSHGTASDAPAKSPESELETETLHG
jgi:sec-independent protein translocase protein TatB